MINVYFKRKNIDDIVPLNIKYFIESLQISEEQGTLNVVMQQMSTTRGLKARKAPMETT